MQPKPDDNVPGSDACERTNIAARSNWAPKSARLNIKNSPAFLSHPFFFLDFLTLDNTAFPISTPATLNRQTDKGLTGVLSLHLQVSV